MQGTGFRTQKSPGATFRQLRPTTTNQWVSRSTTKTTTIQMVVRSKDAIHSGRLHQTLARLHGITASPNRARRVPTALARNEFSRSPCISKAKLVVMPHEGQGIPVRDRNVQ